MPVLLALIVPQPAPALAAPLPCGCLELAWCRCGRPEMGPERFGPQFRHKEPTAADRPCEPPHPCGCDSLDPCRCGWAARRLRTYPTAVAIAQTCPLAAAWGLSQ